MKAVIQRVKSSNVKVSNEVIGSIDKGLIVFLGISTEDVENKGQKELILKMIKKIINMRVWEDKDGKMNKSLVDEDGEILVVSNFTLYGDATSGTRPSYTKAAKPDDAEVIYNDFIEELKKNNIKKVETGKFRAMMDVEVLNDGPVTIILEI